MAPLSLELGVSGGAGSLVGIGLELAYWQRWMLESLYLLGRPFFIRGGNFVFSAVVCGLCCCTLCFVCWFVLLLACLLAVLLPYMVEVVLLECCVGSCC